LGKLETECVRYCFRQLRGYNQQHCSTPSDRRSLGNTHERGKTVLNRESLAVKLINFSHIANPTRNLWL